MKNMSSKRSIIAIIPLSLALAGYGFTLIDSQPPAAIYDISAPNVSKDGERVPWQLIVEEPGTVRALSTNRITLVRDGNSIQYFKDARWTDRGPRLIQARLIETLENTGRIDAVGRETSGLNADIRLKSELRSFQAVYGSGQVPTIKVELSTKLVSSKSREVLAAEVFSASSKADSGRIADIVAAFDEALGDVAIQMSDWAFANGE